jgi:hypothetical protein
MGVRVDEWVDRGGDAVTDAGVELAGRQTHPARRSNQAMVVRSRPGSTATVTAGSSITFVRDG